MVFRSFAWKYLVRVDFQNCTLGLIENVSSLGVQTAHGISQISILCINEQHMEQAE